MDTKELEAQVESRAKGKQTTHEQFVDLADELNIAADELGNALNETKIRVIHCQTGGLE